MQNMPKLEFGFWDLDFHSRADSRTRTDSSDYKSSAIPVMLCQLIANSKIQVPNSNSDTSLASYYWNLDFGIWNLL